MQPRLTLITLGVPDLGRARAFYEALGFKAGRASNDSVTFFPAAGVVLALWGRAALAVDAGVADKPTGFAGVALGQPFTLVFTMLELAVLFLAAIILNLIVHDGRSNWFEGVMLTAVYIIIAIAFFFAG